MKSEGLSELLQTPCSWTLLSVLAIKDGRNGRNKQHPKGVFLVRDYRMVISPEVMSAFSSVNSNNFF